MSQPATIICPNCKTSNRMGAKHCTRCGQVLPTPAHAQPSPAAPRPPSYQPPPAAAPAMGAPGSVPRPNLLRGRLRGALPWLGGLVLGSVLTLGAMFGLNAINPAGSGNPSVTPTVISAAQPTATTLATVSPATATPTLLPAIAATNTAQPPLAARTQAPGATPDAATTPALPAEAHPLLGKKAPPFILSDANGNRQSLTQAKWKDKPIVLIFWDSRIANIATELKARQTEAAGKDVQLIGINMGELAEDVKSVTGGVQYPMLFDEQLSIANAYRVESTLPAYYFIGKDSTIRRVHNGSMPAQDFGALLNETIK